MRRTGTRLRREPWLLVVPALAYLIVVHYLPYMAGGWYAFTSWDGLSAQARWTGISNFKEIWNDHIVRGALIHTLQLAAAFVIIVNIAGLMLALGLHRTVKSRMILRSVFFLPAVVTPLALTFIWAYIFDNNGLLNQSFRAVGLSEWEKPWLGDPGWALWTVLAVLVWEYTGLVMILYLAGMQGIAPELEEAAAVDGATTWQRFRRIVLPLLAPAVTVAVVLTTIVGLRVFDQVLALTGGGPVYASETLATQIYQQTFVFGRFGYGSALAVVLTGLLAALAILQLAILRRREGRA